MRRSSSSCASGRGRRRWSLASIPTETPSTGARDHVARQRDAQARAEAARTAKAPRRVGALRRRGRGSRRSGERAPASSLCTCSSPARRWRRSCSRGSRCCRIRPGRSASTAEPTCRPALASTCLALWRLSDPGNVGTLLRTADAFGACVALSEGCADPLSPKALRASAGAVFRTPIVSWEDAPADAASRSSPTAAPHWPRPTSPRRSHSSSGAERAGLPDEQLTRVLHGRRSRWRRGRSP